MTAVEFIREKLFCDEYWFEKLTFEQIIEQAKEMEKKQIMDAVEYHIDLLNETEISDEEIEKAANENSINYKQRYMASRSFMDGAEWYREQLKNK